MRTNFRNLSNWWTVHRICRSLRILVSYIFLTIHFPSRSRNSAIGIAIVYILDDRGVGVWIRIGSRIFSMLSRLAVGPSQPPNQWKPGVLSPGVLSPGVKRPGRETDHSPPASAEVKKTWIYTSTPPYAFMGQLYVTSSIFQVHPLT
jgi:hypothetical protein